jgi:uncharacterized protein YciI
VRHFVLEGRHLMPFSEIGADLKAAHYAFLQDGMDAGRFLFSGPKVPATGGFLIARAESAEDLRDYLAAEPYTSNGVMTFAAMTEFFPRQHSPLLTTWFT